MAIKELTFPEAINSSLQIEDIIYYTAPPNSAGITEKPLPAGVVTEILRPQGVVKYDMRQGTQPVVGSFILFSKHVQVNESSLKGYYADVTFTNRSTRKAELFAVSSDISLSSK